MVEQEYKPNEILEQGAISDKEMRVVYYKPPLHRRVLANLIDIFVFVVLFASLFMASRAIVQSTGTYQQNMTTLDEIRLNSGLYIKKNTGEIVDIITYLNSDTAFNSEYKKTESKSAVEKFINYSEIVCDTETFKEILIDYNAYRIDSSMVYKNDSSAYNGTPLFVVDEDNKIVENPALFAPGSYVSNIYGYYYDNVYKPYIDSHAQGYLSTRIPGFYDITRYLALMIIFAVIMPAYLLAGILVFYIPTLFFVRGRRTLGKALYRIGLVDSRILSPTLARSTARFAIFYFAELILSIVTFGLPYLISFSLMVFSKNKQGFPDYMLGLLEIDMSRTKIYKSFDEADLDSIKVHGKAVDFKVPNFD